MSQRDTWTSLKKPLTNHLDSSAIRRIASDVIVVPSSSRSIPSSVASNGTASVRSVRPSSRSCNPTSTPPTSPSTRSHRSTTRPSCVHRRRLRARPMIRPSACRSSVTPTSASTRSAATERHESHDIDDGRRTTLGHLKMLAELPEPRPQRMHLRYVFFFLLARDVPPATRAAWAAAAQQQQMQSS